MNTVVHLNYDRRIKMGVWFCPDMWLHLRRAPWLCALARHPGYGPRAHSPATLRHPGRAWGERGGR